jgi:hypothetical protein
MPGVFLIGYMPVKKSICPVRVTVRDRARCGRPLCRGVDSRSVSSTNDSGRPAVQAQGIGLARRDRRRETLSIPTKEKRIVGIEQDSQPDLALSPEDAEKVAGGHRQVKKAVKPSHPVPAEVDSTVQASGGPWQPVVDDPSDDC